MECHRNCGCDRALATVLTDRRVQESGCFWTHRLTLALKVAQERALTQRVPEEFAYVVSKTVALMRSALGKACFQCSQNGHKVVSQWSWSALLFLEALAVLLTDPGVVLEFWDACGALGVLLEPT